MDLMMWLSKQVINSNQVFHLVYFLVYLLFFHSFTYIIMFH